MSSTESFLEKPSTVTMNWGDDNEAVIYLSGSSFTPPHNSRDFPGIASSSSSDSDSEVVDLTDNEDDDPIRQHWPPPVKAISSNGQLNVFEASHPGPSVHVDPFIAYVARVLEIIPDVEPTHLLTLLERYSSSDDVVEYVLHILFEDPSYPRAEKVNGKSKRARDEEREELELEIDYASIDRSVISGPDYHDLAISQLLEDFPWTPKPYIGATLEAHRGLYVPTHLFLAKVALPNDVPCMKDRIPSRVTGKRKQVHDPEFDKERAWLVEYLAREKVALEPGGNRGDDDEECEDGVECGCCFSKFASVKMIQCSEHHLFCRSCCRSYAAILLGQHDHHLRCMDQSGCQQLLAESQLARFLPEKLLALYHRLKQQEEIAAAGLEGLEECPFCDYKVVIDNPYEKLFRCESAECGVVSCLVCKKPDHLPKSCHEAQYDNHLSIRHVIEEAMTKALMRNCPHCNKGFVKENGCNKMICPNCRTLSCYICRQVISGYEHFNAPPSYTGTPACDLWDPIERRHENEVTAAAKRAIEEYKAAHPDVPEEAFNFDLPGLPRPPVTSPPRVPPPRLQAQAAQRIANRVQGVIVPARWKPDLDERIIAQGVAAQQRRRRWFSSKI